MTKTTPDTLTDEQIEALRAEAAAAGDTAQRVICCIALDGRQDADGVDILDYEDVTLRTALQDMTQDDARAECARVIADGEAQE